MLFTLKSVKLWEALDIYFIVHTLVTFMRNGIPG